MNRFAVVPLLLCVAILCWIGEASRRRPTDVPRTRPFPRGGDKVSVWLDGRPTKFMGADDSVAVVQGRDAEGWHLRASLDPAGQSGAWYVIPCPPFELRPEK